MDAKEITAKIYNKKLYRYGAPRILVSQRLISVFCEILQITRHEPSSYHPQKNSAWERQNSTIAKDLFWSKSGVFNAIRKFPGMQPTLICTISPYVGRDQPLCLKTIREETTNSTSNKSWKPLKSVRKMHRKMNNSSKTETNNDMINITKFHCSNGEKVLLKKTRSTHMKKKMWDVPEYFHRFR